VSAKSDDKAIASDTGETEFTKKLSAIKNEIPYSKRSSAQGRRTANINSEGRSLLNVMSLRRNSVAKIFQNHTREDTLIINYLFAKFAVKPLLGNLFSTDT